MLSFIKGQNSKVVNMGTTWVWQIAFEKICINVIGKKYLLYADARNHFINVCHFGKGINCEIYDATPKLK